MAKFSYKNKRIQKIYFFTCENRSKMDKLKEFSNKLLQRISFHKLFVLQLQCTWTEIKHLFGKTDCVITIIIIILTLIS